MGESQETEYTTVFERCGQDADGVDALKAWNLNEFLIQNIIDLENDRRGSCSWKISQAVDENCKWTKGS